MYSTNAKIITSIVVVNFVAVASWFPTGQPQRSVSNDCAILYRRTWLKKIQVQEDLELRVYRGTSPIRKRAPLAPYRRSRPRVLGGWAFSYGQGTPGGTLLKG